MNHSFGKISGSLLLLAMLAAPIFANDFWLTIEEAEKCSIGDGLSRLLGGGGGGITTKISCGIRNESGPKDIFQCYAPDSNGVCQQNGIYAIKTTLPVVGEIKPLEKDINCYRYKDEAYIVIETAIPEQVRDSITHHPAGFKCFEDLSTCQKSLATPDSLQNYEKYFKVCKNSVTTQEGCPVTDTGISLVFDSNGKLNVKSLEALKFYLSLKAEDNVSKFMERAEQEQNRYNYYRITYPWKFSEEKTDSLVNETILKSKGMLFYSGLKKINREDAHFTSMQDAIKMCKEWVRK